MSSDRRRSAGLYPASVPTSDTSKAGRIVATLAEHAAQLFGPPHASGGAPTRAVDFQDMTLLELAVGTDEGSRIPAPTMNTFRPSRKAAATLVAANALLSESTIAATKALTAFMDCLGDVPLDPVAAERAGAEELPVAWSRMLAVAVWARMVEYAYSSSPALFAAATQARGIQRASLIDWSSTILRVDNADRAAESDAEALGSGTDTVRAERSPDTLAAADHTIDTLQRFLPDPHLRDAVVDRWLTELLSVGYSERREQRGFVWESQVAPDAVRVEVYGGGIVWRLSGLAATFDLSGACPVEAYDYLVLPAVDSIRDWDERTRAMLVLTFRSAHQHVRHHEKEEPNKTRNPRHAEEAAALAAWSEDVLGHGHVISALCRATALRTDAPIRRLDGPDAVRPLAAALEGAIDDLGTHWRAGRLVPGLFATVQMDLLVAANSLHRMLQRHGQGSEGATDLLRSGWAEFFDALDIQIIGNTSNMTLTSMRESAPDVLRRLDRIPVSISSYASFLAELELDDVEDAFVLMTEVTLPTKRRLLDRGALGSGSMRASRQITLRICAAILGAAAEGRGRFQVPARQEGRRLCRSLFRENDAASVFTTQVMWTVETFNTARSIVMYLAQDPDYDPALDATNGQGDPVERSQLFGMFARHAREFVASPSGRQHAMAVDLLIEQIEGPVQPLPDSIGIGGGDE